MAEQTFAADATQAAAQDAIAETLLPPEEREQAAQESEPETAPELEAAETESEAGLEEDADWLPSEQEKVFPLETLQKFGSRYGYSAKEIEADPRLQRALGEKLNTDIYLRQQKEIQEQEEFQGPAQPQAQQYDYETHIANLSQFAKQVTDPRIAQSFTNQFLKAFGVEGQATPQQAQDFTETMTVFGMNLLQTVLPDLVPQVLNQSMPDIQSMYYTSARARSWDGVRNSDPAFNELPAYGTREFLQLCETLDEEFPALTEMGHNLANANGGELYGQRADKFYLTLAKQALKLQGSESPKVAKDAFEAGQKSMKRADIRRSAGDLGAGKSKTAVPYGQAKFESNADIFDEGLALWKGQHGNL